MEQKVKSGESQTLPVFLWAVVPVVLILIQICIEIFVPYQYLGPMHTEGGPHEALQFLIVCACVLLAARMVFQIKDLYLRLWIGLAALGCFYIAGEEVSWGQHIFGWVTPEFWSVVNDQNETNLHNTSSWLDQKPRLLLFLGALFAGIVIPALRRWKPSWIPARFTPLYPSNLLFVPALGVLLPYSVQEIAEHFFKGGVFERVSEVQELYLYYFILLYLLDFRKRIILN